MPKGSMKPKAQRRRAPPQEEGQRADPGGHRLRGLEGHQPAAAVHVRPGPRSRARQVTGNNQQQQSEIALAIKIAREMALLPYNNQITTQRSTSRSRDDNRIDGPAPRPTSPPPGMRSPGEMDYDEREAMEMPAEEVARAESTEEETVT